MEIIKLEKVCKNYGEIKAIKDVCLTVEKGEWVTIMGPSGSGKTTLLNIIAGLDIPTSGKVIVGGKELNSMSGDELAEWRAENVGFIFQQYHLIPYLTALENVMLAQFMHSIPDEFEAEMILKKVKMGHRISHYPSQLSGGECQRVAIARAIVNKPAILLADEPTGNLDRENTEIFLNLVKDLQKEMQLTVVVVTHNPYISKWGDRTLLLEDGILRCL